VTWSGPQDVHPELVRRLLAVDEECRRLHGWGLRYESGWRSSAHQGELYTCWLARRPGCNPANPPGTSNHEAVPYHDGQRIALAVDIYPDKVGATRDDYLLVQEVCKRHGLHFPIGSELWHAQLVETVFGFWTELPFIPRDNVRKREELEDMPGMVVEPGRNNKLYYRNLPGAVTFMSGGMGPPKVDSPGKNEYVAQNGALYRAVCGLLGDIWLDETTWVTGLERSFPLPHKSGLIDVSCWGPNQVLVAVTYDL
jgi:hypothetical protein